MPKIIAIIIALIVFSAWLSVIGNPHVIETILGLILSAIAGIWAYIELRKMKIFKNKTKS
jgi:hypothetical protein